ncbi:MAG TPA: hypothetical protein VHM02_15075, partial [Thermoanaerobaculia bacterium]|nr:hypothetical protein [Thermoanaerobaculia bacterium]
VGERVAGLHLGAVDDPPPAAVAPGEAPDGAPAAALAGRYGGRWRIGERLGTARHGITFRDLELIVHRAEVEAGDALADGPAEAAWHPRPALAGLPLSSMVPKALAAAAPATSRRGGRRR